MCNIALEDINDIQSNRNDNRDVAFRYRSISRWTLARSGAAAATTVLNGRVEAPIHCCTAV
jgi:hypothetical protein